MNSKSVLNKILTLLSLDSSEVNFTDAQTADGTILQSPTFDLGEDVEVVSEDGTKTPAPDGEHEIALRDSEGNEVVIRIETKDGKITERENVEEKNPEVGDDMEEEVVDKKADEVAKEDDVKMADADAEMLPAKGLPNTTDEDKANEVPDAEPKDDVISMGYRIEELEKAMKMMIEKMGMETSPVDEESVEEDDMPEDGVAMEEELPKLDGAPIESHKPFNFAEQNSKNYGKKVKNSQSSFLSKLYS